MESSRVDYSNQKVLADFRRDELQQEILAPRTDTSRDHGLEERIAQLTQEDLATVLKWALNKGLLRNPTVSRLENMVTRLSEENRAELLKWAVERDNMSDPMIIWLEGADTLAEVFSDNTPKAQWLLQRGAQLKPRPTMLTVLYRQYGNGQLVESFAKTCSREDLEYVVSWQGVRLTPRCVFDLLSTPTVRVELASGNVHEVSESLFRLRSPWFAAALRWHREGDCFDMKDVGEQDIKFIIHYLESHPDDVDWQRPHTSVLEISADQYNIIGLVLRSKEPQYLTIAPNTFSRVESILATRSLDAMLGQEGFRSPDNLRLR
ncbi:hypothetical protein LTR56_027821, partial [Elasticomyces elasticus]